MCMLTRIRFIRPSSSQKEKKISIGRFIGPHNKIPRHQYQLISFGHYLHRAVGVIELRSLEEIKDSSHLNNFQAETY